ncbi:MAG: Fur family transcriptional regulator [Nautiliaceae bacterium]
MKDYKSLLVNTSLKITPQRLTLLKEIDKKGHASIDELYREIQKQFPTISLATIYKNITSLQEAGVISEICIHQKPKYEIKKHPHAHFICRNCGKIIDIPFDELVSEEIERRYPNSQKELYIYGLCKECNGNS